MSVSRATLRIGGWAGVGDLAHLVDQASRDLGGEPQRHLVVIRQARQQFGDALLAQNGPLFPQVSAALAQSGQAGS